MCCTAHLQVSRTELRTGHRADTWQSCLLCVFVVGWCVCSCFFLEIHFSFAIPCVSDLRDVDLPCFHFSSSQAFINSGEFVRMNRSWVSSERHNIERLERLPSRFAHAWILSNPVSRLVLHCHCIFVMLSRLRFFIENFVVLFQYRQVFRQFVFCPAGHQDFFGMALWKHSCVCILCNSGLSGNE